jgi:hypothetical protein
MPLSPVVLDDPLKWADFNAMSLQRIPAASGGRWTLHAPVDPGVTLLELFAWLLEQRVYWMDQVSDPLTRALLTLLGITPRKALAATTVLYIEPKPGGLSAALDLPGGTQVRLANGLGVPVFSTNDSVTIYPLAAPSLRRLGTPQVRLFVGNSNRTSDLGQGRPTALLAPDGTPTKIVLSLAAAPGAGTLALFFDLSTPPGLEPGWSPTAADGPAGPAAVTWTGTINGNPTPFLLKPEDDGTLGLRRSGIVRLTIPSGWTPEPNSTNDYSVVLSAANTGWTFPPRVIRLVPNVVSAEHSRPALLPDGYSQKQLQGWRYLPGNVFALPEGEQPALASTFSVALTERDPTTPTPAPWRRVADFSTAGPEDRVFVYDAASGQLRFGDGVAGRLPLPKDTSSLALTYQVGGGSAGNLGAALAWETVAPLPLCLRNLVPAAGGVDEESPDTLRARAPEVLKATGRGITRDNFVALATRITDPTTGKATGTTIIRARAAVGRHPLFPHQVVPGAVTVFLVPDVPRNTDGSPDYGTDDAFPPGPVPDEPTLAAVRARLDQARLVTSEVYVCAANYRAVTIALTVSAGPAGTQELRDGLGRALQKYCDPLVGGDDGRGWPFGGPVRPSSLLRVAQDAVGNAGTVSAVSVTLDGDPATTQSCADVRIGADDLITLRQVTVTFQRPVAGPGGLR